NPLMKIDQKELLELGYQKLLGDGQSWSTVVEEGELVDTSRTRATTSSIIAMTSGVGRSTLGGGVSN
ncbi:hypothetical protein Tco_0048707, partial [Tanacetum coccineum]